MLDKKINKRKFTVGGSYRELLSTYAVTDLKNIVKAWDLKGYSKAKKDELVELILEHVDFNLESMMFGFNLDHFSIVSELLNGKNVCEKYPVAASEMIDLGLILEGNIDGQTSLVMPLEISEQFMNFYSSQNEVITINTVMKDYMEFMISCYGVVREEIYIDAMHQFYDENLNKDLIKKLVYSTSTRTRNVSYENGILYYYRLAEYEKVLQDIESKDDIDYKVLDSNMFQKFIEDNNMLWLDQYNTLDKVISKHFPNRNTEDIIDELLIMSAYNHGISDFIQLFSKKEEGSDMVSLKAFADTALTVNSEINHWELKGHSLIDMSKIKRKPIVKGDKIGRNDPCPCGSGKKYKKCCMNK